MGELGLLGITAEEKYGGSGLGLYRTCNRNARNKQSICFCWVILWSSF